MREVSSLGESGWKENKIASARAMRNDSIPKTTSARAKGNDIIPVALGRCTGSCTGEGEEGKVRMDMTRAVMPEDKIGWNSEAGRQVIRECLRQERRAARTIMCI